MPDIAARVTAIQLARAIASHTKALARPAEELETMFSTIIAGAEPNDAECIEALRALLAAIGGFKLDPTLSAKDWHATGRVADALYRWKSQPEILGSLSEAHDTKSATSHGQHYGESLRPALTPERVLLRLEDLRRVIGVAIEPANVKLHTPTAKFDPAQAGNELQRMTEMGFHTVRVELDVPLDPKTSKPTIDFLQHLATYNTSKPPHAQLRVDLVVNFRGGPNNPYFALDAGEVHDDPQFADNKRGYAIALLARIASKPRVRGALELLETVTAASTLSPALEARVIGMAVAVLGGNADDYRKAFLGRTITEVGTKLGNEAMKVVDSMPWLRASLSTVELGNEPEAQWHTPGVHFDEPTRDATIADAAMAAFDVPGVTAIPAAHEWDPASEQSLITDVFHRVRKLGKETVEDIEPMVAGSPWGRALTAYGEAQGKLHPPKGSSRHHVPLSIHIYNHPMLARALIQAVAAVANNHNIVFDVSVTELQIDGYSQHPTPSKLAQGIVELGVHVMDEAARWKPALDIVQMIAFSYHHVGTGGQDFALRGNQPLTAMLGDPA